MIDQTIAHYRITAKLGEGGMGEVYRATDTKLNRDVAIKVIPDSFAQDADRMARFAREAQVLASLNHPNIAAIYGVEERALVMELVEGPTLAERIGAGAIPLEEALPIARQIAEALEYAHERGIIHRDLKPANIKVTSEGCVKVLDFGLAKALSSDAAAADPGSSPTLTMRATMAGMIMGTAAYMSPEQAKGKAVDRRADIWAFGVVLVEMLTGRQMYTGDTISETLAAVLLKEPNLAGIPEGAIRRLLKRCLDKDPRKRLRDIGEARIALEEAPAKEPAAAPVPAWKGTVPIWAAVVLAALAAGAPLLVWRAMRPADRPMMRFSADLGPDAVAGPRMTAAISLDGIRLVFIVRGSNGQPQLATRLLDQSKATILAGTEGAFDPFFSPDSQWIGFYAEGKMKKISVQGGAAVTLCDATLLRGASWGEDGNIIAALDGNHLSRVPAAGGMPQPLSKPEDRGERTNRWPQILPGGQMVLFTAHSANTGFDDANIEVLNLKTGQTKVVQRGGYFGRYLLSGHLVYLHQGTLFGVPFDAGSLETKGTPAPLLEDVAGNAGQAGGQFDFSRTGTWVYLSGKASASGWPLVWLDSAGKTQPLQPAPGQYLLPRVSPDGKRVAVSKDADIWVYDPQRDTMSRLTFTSQTNRYPVWTPDGGHIVFSSSAAGGAIWWIRADGSGQPQQLLEAKDLLAPTSFTPDGRRLAFTQSSAGTGADIWTLPLDTSDPDHPKPGKPEPFLRTEKNELDPAFSPDGRWLAYASDESGTFEVFVRPVPGSASGGAPSGSGKWQISAGGGRYPLWSRNGRELFYEDPGSQIMVAGYTVKGDTLTANKARQWSDKTISRTGTLRNLDLAPDGKRFVVFPASEAKGDDKATVHVTFLLDFFDELRRRLPPGGK